MSLAKLKKMQAAEDWATPLARWSFGTLANQMVKDGKATRAELRGATSLQEGNYRHFTTFAERFTKSQATALTKAQVSWRTCSKMLCDLTDSQRNKLVKMVVDERLDSTKVVNRIHKLRGTTPEARLGRDRGGPVDTLVERATDATRAAEAFVRLVEAGEIPKPAKRAQTQLLSVLRDAVTHLRAAESAAQDPSLFE